MRAPILAVGLLATAITAWFAWILFYVMALGHSAALGYVVAGAAIAGPLFGAIAGTHSRRWGPLVTGSALGAVVLVVTYSILVRGDYG